MLGTATSFAMAATQARAGLGYWGALLTSAVQTGFCGALTTVSTLVAEVRRGKGECGVAGGWVGQADLPRSRVPD